MSLHLDFHGKRAIVTGGSRGVGRAICLLLARAGAEVVFSYQSREQYARDTELAARRAGGTCQAWPADFLLEDDLQRFFSRLDQHWPNGADFFIANAGIWAPEDEAVWEMSAQRWRKTMAVNLDAVFAATKLVASRLRAAGRIVYIGSTAGQRGEAFHVDYAATKGALIAMVKGLCIEFAPKQITVNCVAPGWIDTEMCKEVFSRPGYRQRVEEGIPLKRIASPEDVAGPAVFLCSDLARHITGEVLNVNGGSVLCG